MAGSDSEKKSKKLFYNRLARAIIPAGKQTETGEDIYDDEDWTNMKIKLTDQHFVYEKEGEKGTIEVDDIYYIDRVFPHPKADSPKVLSFNYQTEEGDFVALIKNRTTRSKEILKKRLLRQIIKDANIWYISPRSVGLQDSVNQGWNEGVFKIGEDNTLRIENTNGEVVTTIPPEDVIRLNPITKAKRVNLKIFYWIEDEVQVDLVYSTEIPLELVSDFFYTDYLEEEKEERVSDLSPKEQKTLMAMMEKEDEQEEEVTLSEEKLISSLSMKEEEAQEILSSLESKDLICRMGSKILRTFSGVNNTPEKIVEKEEENKGKELKKKAKELKKRLEALKSMKDEKQS